ncbi:hypothetical protein O6H91_16G001800 [Diphasiastrum complanatum]|uniref:Uncharacterized protein n=1 Tax=Diphasiastrum complanatum TaxID=34168 RepID=A0ACC2B983_DIPCM|nr:hypothetical protein O6H91_16G001800 [Diphasiastrum complanatum]
MWKKIWEMHLMSLSREASISSIQLRFGAMKHLGDFVHTEVPWIWSKAGQQSSGVEFRVVQSHGVGSSEFVYGYQGIPSGKSAEQMIGRFLLRQAIQEASKASLSPKIATKFFTIPWTNFLVGGGFRLGRKSLLDALTASLKRLGKSKIDLYQIHFPFPTFSNSALMESLKEAVELGLTSAVGVSNYSKVQMEEAADLLAQYRVPLASNQVKYSLLSRKAEEEGLLKVCKERSITLIAYSPLESGLLSAKTFQRKDRRALQVQPLLRTLEKIGQESGGKSITQVALNYLVCKGALPIPGCKTTNQAKEHCGVLDWRLEADQVAALDQEAKLLKA